ncbi:hypothetical protein TNCV_1028841 [Trichonephila clavipes]|nr:hypothetical protein TNCV_1028841 [Trichonephila clavipes]
MSRCSGQEVSQTKMGEITKSTDEWARKQELLNAPMRKCCEMKRSTSKQVESLIQNKSEVFTSTVWTATAGSDVVQSGRPILDDFFQHLWPYTGNNMANVVFQMVKRLWLIRIDQ